MKVGTLEIELLANVARLQSDMDKAKRSVGGAVDTMNKILGTIGVGISVAGFASLIKSVADVGDHMNDLRKITGLTIEQLGGLGKLAKLNGTDLDSVAKAVGVMAKNMYAGSAAFDALGIATKDSAGQLRNADQVLFEVADRFSKMADGVQKSAIANQIFGKSGRDLIPMLNEGRAAMEQATEAYRLNSGMTRELAEQSDRFNDILTLLQGKVTSTKNFFVQGLLPSLNDIGSAFLNAAGGANSLVKAGEYLGIFFKGVVGTVVTAYNALKSLGVAFNGIAMQLFHLSNLDFKKAIGAGNEYFATINNIAKGNASFIKSLIDGDKSTEKLTETQKESLKIERQMPVAIAATTQAMKQKKALTDAEQLALLRQNEATRQTISLAQKVESVTESVATEQERYNQKLMELEKLKPYLGIETYNRALVKAQDELRSTERSTVSTTANVSQLWIQAGRNIQSSLSSSLFAFFDTGLSGMVDSVKRAVMQITAEFAALKIGQTLGLDKIFGVNSGIGGTGSAGSGIQNILGLGGLFGKGNATQLAAQRGSLALWGSTGTSSGGLSSLIGAAGGLSSVAGALGALGLSVGIGSSIAGKNKIGGLGGTEMSLIGAAVAGPLGAIVGGAINKLFGREPYKFRQQSLQGTASIGGFDGDITNVFRSKGGLFMSNKHKSVSQSLTQEQQDAFDTALNGFYGSAHKFAENLGLNVDLVDGFTKEFQIKSEKNQQLTSEAIEEMLSGLGNDIAKNALPIVDSFRKAGEDSFATLSRLSDEFVSLKQAAENLGATSEYAKKLISGLSIQARSDFLAMAGGAEALAASSAFFYQNFLSDAERFSLASTRLTGELKSLGLSADLTIQQFKQLVQAETTTAELRSGLLNIIVDFYTVKSAADAAGSAINGLSKDITQGFINNLVGAFEALKIAVEKERSSITDKYNSAISLVNENIQIVTSSIGKLTAFSDSLRQAVNELRPMDRAFAQRIVENSIKSGNLDSPQLQFAVDTLKNKSSSGFSSSFEFARAQAKSASLLSQLGSAADKQISEQQSLLAELNSQKILLDSAFQAELQRLDSMLVQGQMQIDSLNGINTSVLNLAQAISQFNLRANQAGVNGVGGGFSGNAKVSDQQIRDFIKTPGLSDMDIYNSAKNNGVSFEQFSAATGKNLQDLYKWAELNGVPKFEKGTPFVPKTGLAIVHKGERITPASQNVAQSSGFDELLKEIKLMRSEITKQKELWQSVTQGGTSVITKQAAA